MDTCGISLDYFLPTFNTEFTNFQHGAPDVHTLRYPIRDTSNEVWPAKQSRPQPNGLPADTNVPN